MYNKLEQGIKKVLVELGVPEVDFSLDHPKELSHGDYMTNVALIAGKQINKSPAELATNIVEKIIEQKIEGVEKIEVAGPGFINFKLSRSIFVDELVKAGKDSWGKTDIFSGKKILVEHSSPNLFKPFHIGHLMNNTIGEALTRLASCSGAEVVAMTFPSDISLGIAKAIFIILEKYGKDSVPGNVQLLGDAYVEGTKRYEEDESIHHRVKEIADNLFSKKDSDEFVVFNLCKFTNMSYFATMMVNLRSTKMINETFLPTKPTPIGQIESLNVIYESEAGVEGKKIVLENTPKVFTESEGAIVYTPEEEKKLHTSVFINSQGNPTYEAKDIGLLDLKFKRYTPDISITVTDNQQTSHFQVVIDAAGKINPAWQHNSIHRSHGRMSFKGQKMSSRLGGVPLVEDILATIKEEVKEKNPDITEQAAQQISIGAIKFAILKAKAGMNIDFDPETSLSFVGDSGPYLQYTAVRAQSLLAKGERGAVSVVGLPMQTGTEILEKVVARFPEVVLRAQDEWAPHYLVTYLTELAQYFNSWYGQGKIIDEDADATAYRLAVVAAVRQTLENGLWMLGIEVPEKM